MSADIQYRPDRLVFDTYRGVTIAPTPELAAKASEVIKPGYLPPADVIYLADKDAFDLHSSKLLGRSFFVLFTGVDEHTVWFHTIAEKLVKAMPSAWVYFAMPSGSLIPWHEGAEIKISQAKNTVEFLKASKIKPEPICWLWKDWLAKGKMHILGGAPGTGKTTIAIKLAATITNGAYWPDGERAKLGSVLIWSGEDDPADTLVPRLALAGADLSKVYFIGDIHSDEGKRSFDPAKDMEPLGRKLAEIGDITLVIVDPIVSAVAGDSHKNAETRRGLQPLVDLAAAHRFALLGITHFTKGTAGRDPTERITGSLAFGAMARIVMVAAKEQENDEAQQEPAKRLFLRAKSNIGADDGGFIYDLIQSEVIKYPGLYSSAVVWGDPVSGSARNLLAEAENQTIDIQENGSLGQATKFLSELLSEGPISASQIQEDAKGAGHAWATVRRAKSALKIESFKISMKDGWSWQLPTPKVLKFPEDAQQNKVGTFGQIEHLQGDNRILEVII